MTAFKGVAAIATFFKQRATSGDRLGLVYFDSQLSWPRVINLTDNFDYIAKFGDTATDDPERGSLLRIRHGMIPIAGRRSHPFMAFQEANRQFVAERQNSGVIATQSIIYIGDGLSNCKESNCVGTCCNNTYATYNQSMADLALYVSQEYVPKNVSVSVVLTGSYVAPHRLHIYNPNTGKCYDDTGARNDGVPLALNHAGFCSKLAQAGISSSSTYCQDPTNSSYLSNDFAYMAAERPFADPNGRWFQIAAMSGGMWQPLLTYDSAAATTITCASGNTQGNPIVQLKSPQTIEQQMELIVQQFMETDAFTVVDSRA
jgi:hypothetical protein